MLFEDRSRAESFGAAAELYDRTRPSYPAALIDLLLVDGVRIVLDVGCGTGIAGALLAARGCSVIGVEVDARMAALARAKGLEVEVVAFERWEPGPRCFDLVISAQAWHWVDPGAGAARAATALRAGGRLGVFWNFGDPPPHVRERLAPIYARLAPELEKHWTDFDRHGGRIRETVAGIGGCGRFGDPEVESFPWPHTYSARNWADHLGTHSDHLGLAPERRERLLAAVAEAIDALGGSFLMTYETVLVSATMIPARG